MSEIKLSLSEKIINYRTKNEMTQEKFAEVANIDKMTVWRTENGYPCRKTTERKILNVIEIEN